MAEIEFAQIYQNWIDNAYTSFSLFITVLFAYLIAGHFAAKQLPRAAVIGMTLLVCLVLVGPLFSHLGSHLMIYQTTVQYHTQYPEGWVFPPGQPSLIGPLLFGILPALISLVLSIYYVHFVARR
jgi:hypothetical protein